METIIKETLEKQMKLLIKRSHKTSSVKEICLLNKEICNIAKLLLDISNYQIGS